MITIHLRENHHKRAADARTAAEVLRLVKEAFTEPTVDAVVAAARNIDWSDAEQPASPVPTAAVQRGVECLNLKEREAVEDRIDAKIAVAVIDWEEDPGEFGPRRLPSFFLEKRVNEIDWS